MTEHDDTALLNFLKQYEWGACECGRPGDRFVHVRELSFRVCDLCRTRWIAGRDLAPSWRTQTAEDLERNVEELIRYRAISGDPPAWVRKALEDLIERQRNLVRWLVSARN